MADDLTDLGSPVEDWILILNILRGLNQRFEHVGSIIQRYSPFLNFLKVWDDLLLEEIHINRMGPPAAPTMLYTNVASLAAKPPSSTPSCPLGGSTSGNGCNQNKNNKNLNSSNGGDNNGKNSNGGGGYNSSPGQTSDPTTSDDKTSAPWPTYNHPW
jgi:hypothetical protein